jgi:excisionase family DNA binding protein
VSALATLVLEAIREMSDEERHELSTLLVLSTPDQAPDAFLTVQQAARVAACHVETIRRAIRSQALRASQVGSTWRVAETDLKDWMTAPATARAVKPSSRPRQQRAYPARDALDAAFATARAKPPR